MRPSDLQKGDIIITTAESIYKSVPIGSEGTVTFPLCSGGHFDVPHTLFDARFPMVGTPGFSAFFAFDKREHCIAFSGAKVRKTK